MLKHVQVQRSTMETQQTSTSGEFALDYVSPVKLVINKYIEAMSNVCDGLRGDAPVASKEAGLIVCVKLMTEDQVVLIH